MAGLIPQQAIEGPFDPLNIDPARYDPDAVGRRFVAITNSLLDRYKKAGNLRAANAGSETRKGDEYKQRRSTLYDIEAEIEALQKKYDTLRTLIYMRTTEIKHLMG